MSEAKVKKLTQPFLIWLHSITADGTPSLDCYGSHVLHSMTQHSDWYHPALIISVDEYEAMQKELAKAQKKAERAEQTNVDDYAEHRRVEELLKQEIEKLETFRAHVEANGGLCEREPGESQKDCEICYPR